MTNLLNYFFDNTYFNNCNYYHNEDRFQGINSDYRLSKVDDNNFFLEIDMPGHNKNSIEVEITGNTLKVKTKNAKKVFNNYYKKFILADNIEIDDANIKNGLLKITLIRNIPEKEKTKVITIN